MMDLQRRIEMSHSSYSFQAHQGIESQKRKQTFSEVEDNSKTAKQLEQEPGKSPEYLANSQSTCRKISIAIRRCQYGKV